MAQFYFVSNSALLSDNSVFYTWRYGVKSEAYQQPIGCLRNKQLELEEIEAYPKGDSYEI